MDCECLWKGKTKAKGNIHAGGKCKGKGYGASGESKGCAGGEGRSGEHALVADRHYNMGMACINLGGCASATGRWNMWNMPADIILCCEVDVVIYEQMTQEVQTWNQIRLRTRRPAPAARVQ